MRTHTSLSVKLVVLILGLISITVLAPSCKSSKKGKRKSKSTGVAFVQSSTLSAVLDRAKKENKPVFVDFYTKWCTPCKMMDKDVFSEKQLGEYMNKNFISYKVDCESNNGANLAMIFEVMAYPTLVFIDTKGDVLVKHEGGAYHSKMYELGDQAIHLFTSQKSSNKKPYPF